MSQQIIDTGNVAGDGSGDTLFVAFTKTNQNFTELYSTVENQGLTYVNVAIGTTSGNGIGATFNVTRYVDQYSVALHTNGTGFAANDTVTLWGNAVGGDSSVNNVTLTVSTLANATVGNLATFSVSGTPVQPVLSVAGRTGNVVLTVNDVLGAVSPADLQSNVANAKVVVSGWIASNVNSISNLTNVSITNATIVGGTVANATLSNVSGQFSTLDVSGLATVDQLIVNANAIFGGNILPAAGRGILFDDGSFQSTAATSTNLGPVNANVTAANAAIAALQSNAATQATAIAALQGADFATNSALASTNANVATLQSNAASQAVQINSLQTSLSGYATVSAVSATNANVSAANVEIGKLRANITAANAAIAALQSADFATNASVAAANAAITALESNAATQAGQIASTTASIATLTANSASQAVALNSANASIATLTSNAAAQASSLSNLESNAAVQAGLIAALESNAAVQATSLATLTTNAATQASSLNSLTANAAGQSVEISDLRANITAANTNISTLQAQSANFITSANLSAYATVSQLTANVNNLNANDVQQGTLITALQANIAAANTAIAARASLSGAVFTGNISAPNVAISGQLDITGNITVNSIDAVNVVNAATGDFNQVNGLLMTGTQTNITRVGTLVNVTVTGNTVSGNVAATQGTFTSVQGTLLTSSQPNITGVGTLGNLAVAGTVTAANVSSAVVVAGRAEIADGNITVNAVTVTNLSAANVLITDGNLTGVTIGAVNPENGTFAQLTVPYGGNSYLYDITANAVSLVELTANGRVSAPSLDGTLTTNAQPNITSVGNLTVLGVDTDIYSNGNVYVQGNVLAGNVFGTRAGFSQLVGTVFTAAQPNITSVGTLTGLAVSGNVSAGNISATGVSGTLLTAAQPNITSVGSLTALNVSGSISATQDLTVGGNLYVMGNTTNVDTQQLVVNDANITLGNGLPNAASANLGGIYLDGAVAAMYYYHPYDAWLFNKLISPVSIEVQPGGYIGGGTNLVLSGGLNLNSASSQMGNVSLNLLQGTQATFDSVSANLVATTANATTVNATDISGTLLTAAQNNITSVGTLTALSVTGNITNTSGNVNTNGLRVTDEIVAVNGNIKAVAGFIHGNIGTPVQTAITQVGTLTSLSVATTVSATGNILGGNVSGTTGAFVNLAGTLQTNAQPHVTSVGTLVDLSVAGNVTATTLTGTLLTAAQPNITTVGNLVSVNVVGNVTAGNVSATNIVAVGVDGTLLTAAQPNINTVGSLTGLIVLGTTTGNVVIANSFVGPVTGNITGTTASFTDVSGTLLTAAQPNVTSVGSLSALTVLGTTTGNVITANSFVGDLTGNASAIDVLNTNGLTTVYYPTFVENRTNGQTLRADVDLSYRTDTNTLTVGALSVSGNAATGNVSGATGTFTSIRGLLLDSAQTNITSVGTLGTLNVTGNAAAGNVSGTTGAFVDVSGTVQTAAQPNITTVGNLTALAVTGNISTASNISAVGNVSADSVIANNVYGTLTGNASGTTANYTNIIGTLQTAAQPNITSVGTLSALGVTGNASAGNISASTGTFSDVVGTLLTTAQPNITTVGTLTDLTVAGNISAGNITGNFSIATLSANVVSNLANITVANVDSLTANLLTASVGLFTGYMYSFYSESSYQTVFGNIQWTPNLSFPANAVIESNGYARFVTADITSNLVANVGSINTLSVYDSANIANLNVSGFANIVGNSTVGNINGSQAAFDEFVGVLLTNTQPNITSVGNLTVLNVDTDLSVGGNIVLTGSFDASQGNVTLGAVAELNVTGNASIQNRFTANSTSLFSANAEFVSNIDLRGNLNFVDQARLTTNAANVFIFGEPNVANLYLGQNAENIIIGAPEGTSLTRIGTLDANVLIVDTVTVAGDTGFNGNTANIYTPGIQSLAAVVINQIPYDSSGDFAAQVTNITANANLQFQYVSHPVSTTGVYELPSEILGVATGNSYLALVTEAITGGIYDQANTSIMGGNAMVLSANVLYVPGGVPRANISVPENSAGLSYVVIDPPTKLRNTGDSLAIDQGALVVDGGMGVAKNLFVGGNISVQDNSTFAANIIVGNVSVLNKLELLSNIGLSLPNLDGTPIGQTTPAEATFTRINYTETRSNVRPLTININNGRRLDPRLAYTRSGTASYVNSAGNLTYVGTDVAPIHFDANGVCQGLLIEPAATNLARGAISFANTTLYTSYGLTSGPGNAFVANSTTISAPTGLLHAVELYEDSTTGYHGFDYTLGPTPLTSGQTYTVSLYTKANTRSRISVSVLGENDGPVFDLDTGTIVSTGAANYTGADIQRIKTDDQGKHWYRVFATTSKSNVSVATDKVLVFLANATSDVTFAGDNGSGGATVWGLQLENNSFGTGFMESGATATASRSAPTVSITQANTAWAGNTVGMSVAVEAQLNHTRTTAIGSDVRYGLISFEGSATERAVVYVEDDLTGRHADYVVYQNSLQQVNGANLTVSVGNVQQTPIAVGMSLRSNDFSFVVNGGSVQTDSNALPNNLFTVPVWSNMYIGSGAGTNTWNGTVRNIQIYPRKIIDEALQVTTRKQ